MISFRPVGISYQSQPVTKATSAPITTTPTPPTPKKTTSQEQTVTEAIQQFVAIAEAIKKEYFTRRQNECLRTSTPHPIDGFSMCGPRPQ